MTRVGTANLRLCKAKLIGWDTTEGREKWLSVMSLWLLSDFPAVVFF